MLTDLLESQVLNWPLLAGIPGVVPLPVPHKGLGLTNREEGQRIFTNMKRIYSVMKRIYSVMKRIYSNMKRICSVRKRICSVMKRIYSNI
jgi:hypothetical protein